MDPTQFAATAPGTFKVKFETTAGDFVVQVNRDWAPNGADRVYNLVQAGWFTDVAFFRVIDGFMAQFGLHGEPRLNKIWRDARIDDDENTGHSNTRGMVTFATAGPNTRTTQMFINYKDNGMLDREGFTPFGEIVEGMDTVDKLYKGYGEGAPRGGGPSQGLIQKSGNAYLLAKFPELTWVKSASVL
jgi:peptidyl-prolyl cis-trans isomerase A (cyclophilin A)